MLQSRRLWWHCRPTARPSVTVPSCVLTAWWRTMMAAISAAVRTLSVSEHLWWFIHPYIGHLIYIVGVCVILEPRRRLHLDNPSLIDIKRFVLTPSYIRLTCHSDILRIGQHLNNIYLSPYLWQLNRNSVKSVFFFCKVTKYKLTATHTIWV